MSDFVQAAPSAAGAQKRARGFTDAPGVKLVLAGVLSLMLMVPAMIVLALVNERDNRAQEAAASIAAGWGSAQAVNGPYLVIPFRMPDNPQTGARGERRLAIQSAETADIVGDVKVEERRRSIYSLPLYRAEAKLTGRFAPARVDEIAAIGGTPDLGDAYVVFSISDLSGFRSEVVIDFGQGPKPLLPGMREATASRIDLTAWENGAPATDSSFGGIHVPLSAETAGAGFAYSIDMTFNGSRRLIVAPSAATTTLAVQSDWPHPGFGGKFLPDSRELGETGFSAKWSVPTLARGVNQLSLESAMPSPSGLIHIDFVEPLKFYQVIARVLKYAVAFFALTFIAVFLLEMRGGRPLHLIQYALAGFALVIFFVLLLAFAEHIGFGPAYLLSATATTALIAWYVGDAIGERTGYVVMALVLGVLYVLLYLIMRAEEYALLAGAIVAFATIGLTMFATRRIDWSGGDAQAAPARA
jgi:inner membrane protein